MKQLKYIAHYQKDRNWGQINFVVTLAKKDILSNDIVIKTNTAIDECFKMLLKEIDALY